MKFIINENPRSKKHHNYIKKNPKYLNYIHDLLRGYYNSLKLLFFWFKEISSSKNVFCESK
jgi:hypothetical protein